MENSCVLGLYMWGEGMYLPPQVDPCICRLLRKAVQMLSVLPPRNSCGWACLPSAEGCSEPWFSEGRCCWWAQVLSPRVCSSKSYLLQQWFPTSRELVVVLHHRSFLAAEGNAYPRREAVALLSSKNKGLGTSLFHSDKELLKVFDLPF